MTENTVPNSMPEPMDDQSSDGHEGVTPDSTLSSEAETNSDWETVNFPGQLSLGEDGSSGDHPSPTGPEIESTILSPSNSKDSYSNTDELIQLIQDLNHCNDALLNRISNLEEALERSQAALQTEIERNQGVQANGSGPTAQQVAQLLSEIDIANDGLRRATMHNEALQAELDVSQQRVAQLERECTLLQQRFNEKTTALQQAEHTCRDLKSRLHRQQRYTLQFKAALEKCLNMPAHQSTALGVAGDVTSRPGASIQPVAMPKSQHIQPWSSEEQGQQQDVNLSDLLRGLKSSGHGPSIPESVATSVQSSPASAPALEKAADPEAEALLWQDLERVTESQASPSLSPEPDPDPWHTPPQTLPQLNSVVEPKIPASAAAIPDAPVFTEPSPWGEPLQTPKAEATTDSPEAIQESVVANSGAGAFSHETPEEKPQPVVPPQRPAQTDPTAVQLQGYLQETTTRATTSPAPVVYPLRAPKKRKSLAAVELPNFGPAHRRR